MDFKEYISYFRPQLIYQATSSYNRNIEVRMISGRLTLLVNGIQQTGNYTEKLWETGLGEVKIINPKNILIFGVGGGGLFHHLHHRFPQANLTGVDVDVEIIRIAKTYFGLDKLNNLTLIQQDARTFRSDKRYDLVIIDLYIGNGVPDFVSQRPFLDHVYSMLKKRGMLVMNYFHQKNQKEKARHIANFFPDARVKPVLRNMFIYVIK